MALRSLRFRRSITFTCLTAVVALVGACSSNASSGGGTTAKAGATQTLSLWARADDANFLPGLVDSFNASHPTIKLKLTLVPDAQVVQKYSTAASTGSGPNLAAVEIGTIPQFTSTGWLQDITADVNAMSYKSTLSPAHLAQGAVGDKQYALPLTADVSVLYWNKTLFKAAGLDPNKAPTTWAQIAADAKAVRALGGKKYGYYFSGACGGCMGFTMLPYMWANGGDVLNNTGATAIPTLSPNPALAQTVTFFRSLWDSGVVAPTAKTENGSNQFGPFFSGDIGMFVQGTYPFAVLKKTYPNVSFGITNVPSTTGSSSAAYVGGDDIAITKNTDHATGMTVLNWFMTTGQTQLAKEGILPIRSDIATNSYVKQDPRNAVFVKGLMVGNTPKSTKTSVLFDNNGPFEGLVTAGIFGNGSVESEQEKAQSTAVSDFGQ